MPKSALCREIAHRLDEGESLDLTQDNQTRGSTPINDLTQDNEAEVFGGVIDVTHDRGRDLERILALQAQAIALLQNAIMSRAKGGNYAANNATGIKRAVGEALALLVAE